MPIPLPLYSVLPFVAMLLAIALLPLALPHWWESNRNKLLVSAGLGLPVLLLYLARAPRVLAHTAGDYASFIVLLAGLYVIAGGSGSGAISRPRRWSTAPSWPRAPPSPPSSAPPGPPC